jgi:hypothetical protein
MTVRGTGIAVGIAGSAILHVAMLGALDAMDEQSLVGPALPRPSLLLVPHADDAAERPEDRPIEVVLLAPGALPATPASAAPVSSAPADADSRERFVPGPAGRSGQAPLRTPAAPSPVASTAAAATDDDDRLAMATTTAPTTSGATGVAEPGTPTGEPGPGVPGMLSMRNPRDLAPGVDLWHVPLTVAPADPSKPLYQPPEPSGQLHPDGGGTFRTVRPGFTGHVAEDGTVSFTDTPSIHAHIAIPRPDKLARAAARGLERWYGDPGKALRAGEPDPDELPGVRAIEHTDPDESDPDEVIVPILSGGFDATDAVMRANGWDPYLSAKLKWLDETRPERLEMRKAHRKEQLAHATQNMRRHLARLWRQPGLDDAARKAVLFELWDDCDERGDDDVLAACERTRAAVIGFIHARLPAGSPAAYTADELRALNAHRASTIVFAPYD